MANVSPTSPTSHGRRGSLQAVGRSVSGRNERCGVHPAPRAPGVPRRDPSPCVTPCAKPVRLLSDSRRLRPRFSPADVAANGVRRTVFPGMVRRAVVHCVVVHCAMLYCATHGHSLYVAHRFTVHCCAIHGSQEARWRKRRHPAACRCHGRVGTLPTVPAPIHVWSGPKPPVIAADSTGAFGRIHQWSGGRSPVVWKRSAVHRRGQQEQGAPEGTPCPPVLS